MVRIIYSYAHEVYGYAIIKKKIVTQRKESIEAFIAISATSYSFSHMISWIMPAFAPRSYHLFLQGSPSRFATNECEYL